MALRLTSNTLPLSEPANPAQISIPALTMRAQAALASGDFTGYVGLGRDLPEQDDPNRRYHVQRTLIECALDATGAVSAGQAREIFMAAAQVAVEALEENPAEPVLLNYAGVLFYELWALPAATSLFSAAKRLDPSLPHLQRNLSDVRRRTRQTRSLRRSTSPALQALARRATDLAGRAHAAEGLRLSLCMIVRDEEEMLPRCLAAAAPAVDEIIVVDTGSHDRTREIAESFGARVIDHAWTGSFAEARNVSFEAATGDWLIYLDADEVLVAEDVMRLRALCGRTWREAFLFPETNFTGDSDDGTAVTHNALRMFRNRPQYRFEGRLHEQIAHHLPAYAPERLEHTSVRIEHYGYLVAVRHAKQKSRRNIELLHAQLSEAAPTPFLHFNLGSEYAGIGDAAAALAQFQRSWEMMCAEGPDALYEFTPTLLVRLVKCLRVCGQPERAIEQADEGLLRFPGFTDLIFDQALAALALGRLEDARGYYERCIELGDAPAKYTAMRGCGTFLPRIALAELDLQDGDAERARERLEWCMREHPGYPGTILPYAAALLHTGAAPEEVLRQVEARTEAMTPTVRFLLAVSLHEAGALELAEEQYRAVLEAQPHRAPVRVALGENLLAQRRYGEAADAAAAVPAEDPLKPAAMRTELFGLIAGGQAAQAAQLLSNAAEPVLPPAEAELFAGWARICSGHGLPARPLPSAALSLLEVILEALLRVQDFHAFETVLPLLEQCGLSQRGRRELLAKLYLRRGFLASAAEEWMAVCTQTPDVEALLGLAQVAFAHGLPDDAVTFVSEALALDPAHPTARLMHERLQATAMA